MFFPPTEVISSVVTLVGTFAVSKGKKFWHSRRVTTFWRTFVGRPSLRIYYNERKIEGGGTSSEIGRKVGDGYYLTKGMAGAAWRIERFAMQHLVKHDRIEMQGSETGAEPNVPFIVSLGSSDNRTTDRLLRMVNAQFSFGLQVSPEGLKLGDDKPLEPKIDERGNGDDYALVVRAGLKKGSVHEIVIIAGLHMYGTEGAAIALTDETYLSNINAELQAAAKSVGHALDNCAFVLRVAVKDHQPSAGMLDLGERGHIIRGLGPKLDGYAA